MGDTDLSCAIRAAFAPVIALCLLAITACSSGVADPADPPAAPSPSSSAPGAVGSSSSGSTSPRVVDVARAESAPAEDLYPSSLYVEGDVKVTARRTGVIEKVLVDRGLKVKAGQELALLESDVVSRELEMAEQEARLALSEYDQMRALHQQKVVSPQDYLRAEIERDRTASAVALQRAWLERCTVRAPFDGTVVERWAVAGQRVEEDDGTPLFRIVARQPLRARADVPENRLDGIRNNAPATVVGDVQGSTAPARVVFVGPAVDPASGTAPVIVELTEEKAGFKLGNTVRVRLGAGESDRGGVVRIPLSALPGGTARPGAETSVMVVADGRASARRVRVVGSRAGSAMVRGAIAAEDRVILGAPVGIEDGSPVRVRGDGP
jgi:membrane fusion protein (multidrug efflux system)